MEFDTGNWAMATPPADAASSPPATPAMNEASANAHILYRVVLHAGRHRAGLALADGGPRPAGLAPDLPRGDGEHERAPR